VSAGKQERCCAIVSDGPRTMSFHRCARPAKEWDDKGHGFCLTHGPTKRGETRRRQEAKYEAFKAKLNSEWLAKRYHERLVEFVALCASGDRSADRWAIRVKAQRLLEAIRKDEAS
jgi:hypothetical protein